MAAGQYRAHGVLLFSESGVSWDTVDSERQDRNDQQDKRNEQTHSLAFFVADI